MTQRDLDWRTFKEHEVHVRRESDHYNGHSDASIISEVGALWSVILGQEAGRVASAYVNCIRDCERASQLARNYDLDAVNANDRNVALTNARRPWPPADQRLISQAWQSWRENLFALERFSVEQNRRRNSGERNASRTSLEWTAEEIRTARRVLGIMIRLIRAARGLGPVVVPASVVPAFPAADGAGGEGGDEEREDGGGQGHQGQAEHHQAERQGHGEEKVAANNRRRTRRTSLSRNKVDPRNAPNSRMGNSRRSKRGADDSNRDAAGIRKSRHRSAYPRIVTTREEPAVSQPEKMNDFLLNWQKFLLKERANEDRPQWEKLWDLAKKTAKLLTKFYEPRNSSDEAQKELRLQLERHIPQVVRLDWQTYLDWVGTPHNGVYETEDYAKARQDMHDALRRLEEGHSPVWAPQRREKQSVLADPGVNSGLENEEVPRNPVVYVAKTAAEIAREVGFGGEQIGIEGYWVFSRTIGKGGFGEAGLWLSIGHDEHGTLVQRVVVKNVYHINTWGHASQWIFIDGGDYLVESALHKVLSERAEAAASRSIVTWLGENVCEETRLLRIYMEHCPHGDLSQLLCNHAKIDRRNGTDMLNDQGESIDQVRIPSRAIWAFFEELAEAACIMAYGYIPDKSQEIDYPEWEIFHRDLKPGNVFLAAPIETNGRGVPAIKVGDFGLSVMHNHPAFRNPNDMIGCGTRGWKAPETQSHRDEDNPRYPLSSRSDVWALGRIILALIELTPGLRPNRLRNVEYGDDNNAEVTYTLEKPELIKIYGRKIFDLVARCLKPVPDDRITAQQLVHEIKDHLDETDPIPNGQAKRGPPQLEAGDVLEYISDPNLRWAS